MSKTRNIKRLLGELKRLDEAAQGGDLSFTPDMGNLYGEERAVARLFGRILDRHKAATEYDLMKYRLTSQMLGIAHWELEVADGDPLDPNNKFTWSPELRQMLAFSEGEPYVDTLAGWLCHLHADDKPWVMESFAAHLSDRTGRTPFNLQHRVRMKSGGYRYVRSFCAAFRDKAGTPLRVVGAIENITRQRMIRERLREAEERMQIMLDAVPLVLLMWDRNFKVIDCSQAAVELLEFSGKRELMKRFLSCAPKFQPSGRRSLDVLAEAVARAFETGFARLEWTHLTVRGEPIVFDIPMVRVKYKDDYALMFYARDIREDKKMLAELAQRDEMLAAQAHLYKSILDGIPLPINVTDADMKLIFVNTAAERFFGRKRGELVGRPCSVWNIPTCGTEDCSIAQAKRGLRQVVFKYNGASCRVDTEIIRDRAGETSGFLEILQDVTEVENMARREADAANRAKTAFLAMMSHEIRTPLNAIIGMTELAIREATLNAARNHMLTVRQAGVNLLTIVNDILDLSRIEQGKLEIAPSAYSPASLMNDVINLIRMRVAEKPVCFTVRTDCRMPRALIGDEAKMRQILVNLLGNAVKFTDSGMISLAVRGEATGGDTVDFVAEIADSGIGIKEEDIGGIFSAYTQIGQKNGVHAEGSGLGLTITKGIVTAMGGRIRVESEYGKGSVFTVSLPQKIHDGAPMASVADPGAKSVLIYGDGPAHDESIVYALENLGVRCASVSSDAEFYEELAGGRWAFAFVVSERYESARRIHAEIGSGVRLVLLAAFGDPIPDRDVPILYMPAHATPLTDMLNGVSHRFSYSAGEASTARFTAPGAKVLIVDDIETNLKVADGLMRPYEMRVDLRKSGEGAIEAVRATRYDLVFMDHKMPGMDGVETVRRIRAMGAGEPYYESLPIIALTANAVSGMEEMFLENGFSGFLSKPINLIALDGVLKKWIGLEARQIARPDRAGRGGGLRIEGVDTELGLALLHGDAGLYLETLAVFRQDGLEKIEEIAKSLEADDLGLFAGYLHGLRSACAHVGARELSEAAKALELAGERGDSPYIGANAPPFLSSLTLLLERIDGVLRRHGQERRGGMSEGDAEAFASGLLGLKAAVAEMDAAAMSQSVKELRELARSEDADALMGRIRDNILLAEYEEAIRSIDVFLKEASRGHSVSGRRG